MARPGNGLQSLHRDPFTTFLAFTEVAGFDAVQSIFDLEQQDVIQVVSTAGHPLFVIALGEVAFIGQTQFFIPKHCRASVDTTQYFGSFIFQYLSELSEMRTIENDCLFGYHDDLLLHGLNGRCCDCDVARIMRRDRESVNEPKVMNPPYQFRIGYSAGVAPGRRAGS